MGVLVNIAIAISLMGVKDCDAIHECEAIEYVVAREVVMEQYAEPEDEVCEYEICTICGELKDTEADCVCGQAEYFCPCCEVYFEEYGYNEEQKAEGVEDNIEEEVCYE